MAQINLTVSLHYEVDYPIIKGNNQNIYINKEGSLL